MMQTCAFFIKHHCGQQFCVIVDVHRVCKIMSQMLYNYMEGNVNMRI